MPRQFAPAAHNTSLRTESACVAEKCSFVTRHTAPAVGEGIRSPILTAVLFAECGYARRTKAARDNSGYSQYKTQARAAHARLVTSRKIPTQVDMELIRALPTAKKNAKQGTMEIQ